MASDQANIPVVPDLTGGMQDDGVDKLEAGCLLESQNGSGNDRELTADEIIKIYLMSNVKEYRTLEDLRERGWNNPSADTYFARKRHNGDSASINSTRKQDRQTAVFFYNHMQKIGKELNSTTAAFGIRLDAPHDEGKILDFCMAPGGFLRFAKDTNPASSVTAFSLPTADGGHDVLIELDSSIELKYVDITMFASDMGAEKIPEEHADRQNFLQKQLPDGCFYDLILCDGQVLRTHERAPHRDRKREERRLTATQLALGLERVKAGGSMVVLLHRLECCDTVELLQKFSTFSTVRLFKPKSGHATRSSFYMVATDIHSEDPKAALAVQYWKSIWNVATFGTVEDFEKMISMDKAAAEKLLDDFGSDLIRLGTEVWAVQAAALANAPFIKNDGAGASTQHENARPEPQRPGRWVRGGGKWRLQGQHQRT